MRFWQTVLLAAAAVAVSHSVVSNSAAAQLLDGQWTVERANKWYAGQPPIVGCNFLPSTAVNDVEMWQNDTFDPKTIDKELGLAADWGLNSVRVFLNYVVWEAEAESFKKNFAAFLDLAETHKISVMPVLFDDCNFSGNVAKTGKQQEPVPGVHNSGWVSSPPLSMLGDAAAHPKLKAYLQDMIKTFGRDKRIVIWDLYNEPGNSGQGEKHFDLVKNIFVWAREMKPVQPLTIGTWGGNKRLEQMLMSSSDVVSFHSYGDPNRVKKQVEESKAFGGPVICTEWLCRQADNTPEKILPIFKGNHIGCYHWGLVAGKTQTYFPWGSKKGAPEPEIWQHDLIRTDGSPYLKKEYELFRKFTGKEQ